MLALSCGRHFLLVAYALGVSGSSLNSLAHAIKCSSLEAQNEVNCLKVTEFWYLVAVIMDVERCMFSISFIGAQWLCRMVKWKKMGKRLPFEQGAQSGSRFVQTRSNVFYFVCRRTCTWTV